MRKISSINRSRIGNMYIDRKTVVNKISTVDRVERVKPVQNQSAFADDQLILFADLYYEKFEILKQYYKKFYLHQQEFKEVFNKFKKNKNIQKIDEIILFIEELVEKYNETLLSLYDLETKIEFTHTHENLKDTLSQYQPSLSRIGITVMQNLTMKLNTTILKNTLSRNSSSIQFLFNYKNGFIQKIFFIFKNIQVKPPSINSHYHQDAPLTNTPKGMIVDKKT